MLNRFLLTLMSLSLGLVSTSHAQAQSHIPGGLPAVQSRISLGQKLVNANKASEVAVLVELKGAAQQAASQRQKLNLALVIDRSGSMSDQGKLDYAKQAARNLILAMQPDDTLSVVEYDNSITVLRKAAPLKNKHAVLRAISRLQPRGGTNLAGGMVTGLHQVLNRFDPNRINRVMLLSDGLANEGVTDPRQIANLAAMSRQKGVSITSLGLGQEYNEDLMQAIAERGSGRYYYIEKAEQLATVFNQELKVMTTTVARNIALQFRQSKQVKSVEIIGYNSTQQGAVTRLNQQGLYANESREVLLKIKLNAPASGQLELGLMRLSYLDLQNNTTQSFSQKLSVNASDDALAVQASINSKIAARAALLDAEQQHLAAVKQYEAGNKAQAKRSTAALSQQLQQQNKVWKDVRIKKKIDALNLAASQMDQADRGVTQRNLYLKKAKWIGSLGSRGRSKGGSLGSYMMQRGDNGPRVKELQSALKKAGLYKGKIDGQYSEALEQAVMDYQQQQQLDVDGVVGPMTLTRLKMY